MIRLMRVIGHIPVESADLESLCDVVMSVLVGL